MYHPGPWPCSQLTSQQKTLLYFWVSLSRRGVEAFGGRRAVIEKLRSLGYRASDSRNAAAYRRKRRYRKRVQAIKRERQANELLQPKTAQQIIAELTDADRQRLETAFKQACTEIGYTPGVKKN